MTRRGIYIFSLESLGCIPLRLLVFRLRVGKGVGLVDWFLVLAVSYDHISYVLVILWQLSLGTTLETFFRTLGEPPRPYPAC